MGWTHWKLLADRVTYYNDHMLRHPPVCFELGLAEPGSEVEPRAVFVGAAPSEREALVPLSEGTSPLCRRIDAARSVGEALYYRFRGAPTLAEAEGLAAAREAEARPAWNADAA